MLRLRCTIDDLEPRYAFISFASTDALLAHRAVDAFERAGLRCWIADRDIPVATSYPAAIGAAIKGSGALVLLLTDAANASPHVLREVELAFNSRRPILPIRIAHATPTADLQYFLSTSQWLDTGASFDAEDLARVEPALRSLLDHGRSGTAPLPPSRQWLWIGTAAVVAIAVATALFLRWNADTGAAPSIQQDARGASPSTSTTSATGTAPPDRPRGPAHPAQINPRDGQTYVWIPPGRFAMGCSEGDPACEADEKPVHLVTIRNGFWLARTEVTEAQYRAPGVAARPVASGAALSADMPATAVSWSEAKAYCAGVGGRLPTEAEWEYAARGGVATRSYDRLPVIAWYADNSGDRPHAVGGKTPNAFGLHDMLGNVSEWVLDRYYNAYDDASDPFHPDQPLAENASAVARGGSWVSESDGVRVSRRLEMPPDAQESHIGFRCVIDRL